MIEALSEDSLAQASYVFSHLTNVGVCEASAWTGAESVCEHVCIVFVVDCSTRSRRRTVC